ncbi:D-ribose pyranase [Virgibacillus oceani]|uniref:D-ribose pyranase n=1 Tax=Virgibacillus oceani TaxID=1479511 RepID=A0A917HRZ7_9BACI|nr:D-ribose pyranase [Virgibacillus oceani]GGG88535.1 D-ribose pyranase [Virgibacillus oceani]
MKKSGILNRDITSVLGKLGHTDKIIIADCGLPIPDDTHCIDLSLTLGTPSFITVFKAITDDMEVEEMTIAKEIYDKNIVLHDELKSYYRDVHINYVSHEQLKAEIPKAKAVIRTGEATPFANVILHAGVIF